MIRSCVLVSCVLLSGVFVLGCGNKSRDGGAPVSGFQITTASLPNGTVGSVYSETLVANGAAPYSWAVIGGSYPPGLNLTLANGVVGGTPTTPGSYAFRVRVVDGSGQQAERDFGMNIVDSSVSWGSLNLPGGVVGQAYSTDLRNAASGGTKPYTFTVDSGSLPPGLTLDSNGVLSGTPTTTGQFQVVFRVTAAGGQSSATSGTTIFIS